MGRGRVQMKLIEKQSRNIFFVFRKCVYRNRLNSLKKKGREFSELCDVPAMIISVDSDGKVDTFPENKEDVIAMLNKYNLVSNKAPEKFKQNSESVIQPQILKKQLELNLLKLDNEEAVNPFDTMLVEVRKKIMLHKNKYAQILNYDTNNQQLVTTAESALCTCHEIDDSSVEDYLHGREDSLVEHSHGGKNLLVKDYLHGGEIFSVEDMHDWQAESSQSNDVLSDDIACLLDESNT